MNLLDTSLLDVIPKQLKSLAFKNYPLVFTMISFNIPGTKKIINQSWTWRKAITDLEGKYMGPKYKQFSCKWLRFHGSSFDPLLICVSGK